MTRFRATAIGFTAILMWALLALLTVRTAPVPPFLLTALCFALGGGLGLVWTMATGRLALLRGVPWGAMAFGIAGLFGYHFFYFTALRLAPAAEAGLIAYLWPLFIVLLSGLLPGERLGAGPVAGALLAFGGVALLLLGGDGPGFRAEAAPGFALAALCAVVWAFYSVGSRRFAAVPTEAVTITCLATALLSALAHLALEETAWPIGAGGWLAVLGLGLGPLGVAFFTWDVGMKRGDLPLLGVASYAAPLLSTLILVLAGVTAPRWQLAAAAVLIVGGAGLAAAARKGAKGAETAPGTIAPNATKGA